jgi:hypothetical protein
MHTERTPKFFTDADGQHCARIPLAKRNQFAVLYADDLAKLEAAYVPLNWFANLNGPCDHPRTRAHIKVAIAGDNVRTVARLITGAGKGQQVHYRDGNRFNLRRDNLVVSDGGRATVDAVDLLERQHTAVAERE